MQSLRLLHGTGCQSPSRDLHFLLRSCVAHLPTQSALVQTLCEPNRIFRVQSLLYTKIVVVKLVVLIFTSGACESGLRNRNELLISKLDLFGLIRLSFGFTGRAQFLFFSRSLLALDVRSCPYSMRRDIAYLGLLGRRSFPLAQSCLCRFDHTVEVRDEG